MQAWAALEVFAVDEGRDLEFLSRVFDKLIADVIRRRYGLVRSVGDVLLLVTQQSRV